MSTKRAALINDLSGLGKCSLTAAIPVFSCMGIQPCPLPTAVLSNQTGYDSYYIDDFTDKMSFFTEEWLKKRITFDAISTGFFVNSKQIDISEEFIKKFKKEDTLLVVDPVMGDGGTVYKTFSDELCRRICRLALTADVITPNLTEACIILGEKPDLSLSLENVCDMARRLKEKGPSKVVVTGVVIGDKVYNVVCDDKTVDYTVNNMAFGSYSGTGDLFVSVIAAGLMNGKHSLKEIAQAASDLIESAARDAYAEKTDRNDGVPFEKYLPKLWEALI
ncbi:MAG: pyridoxamine kinase [Oscillospiraceae bacterium]|nr:pyridoxamine kinase [Oscillospiraceae bacterium]